MTAAQRKLTRDDVAGIHGVLVLDEAEAVHELDLGDLASAMGLEMSLNFSLGGIARKIAQVKAGSRDFGHDEVFGGNVNLAWKGSERMLGVNECLADEVCQKRKRCKTRRARQLGTRSPRDANHRGQRDARKVSKERNPTVSGRTLVLWKLVALEVLSQS